MDDQQSIGSTSTDERPVYFRHFTRESLAAIKQRIQEERMTKQLEKMQLNSKEHEPKHHDEEIVDSGPIPDEKLEQGAELPIRMSAAFDEAEGQFEGVPLEDFDPYYSNIPTFVIVTKKKEIFRFIATDAMFLLSPFNPVRRVACTVLTHPLFSFLIITTILANCYVMVLSSNPLTESTEVLFTAIYTFESAVKVMARGFILNKFTYLRDAWNWLDFVVISLAYVTMAIDLGNLAALRTCRVFRALKTVAIVPGLKTIVSAVIVSVMNLRDVIILTVFALAVFGLVGLQIYMGVLTQKCVADFPEDDSEDEERDINWHIWNSNVTNWHPYPPPEEYGAADYPLCGNSSGAGQCPENYTCLQGYGPNPNYGYTSFDSFSWAFLCSFRLMTQDFWESLYQQILRSAGPWHMVFFIVIIFLGSYYLVNLILAIVAMSYDELEAKAESEAMAMEAEKEAMREEEEARLAKSELRAKAAAEKKHAAKKARHQARKDLDPGEADTEDDLDGNILQETEIEFAYKRYHVGNGTCKTGSSRGSQESQSVPGSPIFGRRRAKSRSRLLLTYINAEAHLPFADDSKAVTPLSEDNSGLFLQPFGMSTRYSSYNSHASRLSYTSHDFVTTSGCQHQHQHLTNQNTPITKESQLKQRAKEFGRFHRVCSSGSLEGLGGYGSYGVTVLGDTKRKQEESGSEDEEENQRPVTPDTSVDSEATIEEEEVPPPPTLREIIRAKIVAALLYCLDIFCYWDCGRPWSLFRKAMAFIVFDAFTELTITLATIVCVAFMAMDHYGLEENITMNKILKCGNMVFTVLFTTECAMKIIAMTPKFFFQVGWNIFDFLIVMFSLVEVVFEDAKLPGMSALRSFRLLRVFKLAKSWPTLNMIMSIMGQTVGSLTNLVIVLMIILFIFAVMGTQLFAEDYYNNTHLFPGGEMPRWNFTDFGHSFMIIFRVLCGEWIESMWDCMLVSGGACVPFFLATVLIGNLVLLNLFLALLLSSFGGDNVAPNDSEPNKLSEAFDRIGRFNAWVKRGIKNFFNSIIASIVRVINRMLFWRREEPPEVQDTDMDASEVSEKKMTRTPGQRRKRTKMAEKAKLVMNSRRVGRKDVKITDTGLAANDTEDAQSVKSYSSHEFLSKSAKLNLGFEITEDLEEDEENEHATSVSEYSDDDFDGDNQSEPLIGEIVDDEMPADCMPAAFFEKFPIFDVDETTSFGRWWMNLRLKCFRLIENKYFDTTCIFLILTSSAAMAFEDVNLPNNPLMTDILFHLDRIFTVVFFFEMILKWLAMGYVVFFTNAWCWLDFVIVMVSVLNLGAALIGAGSVQAFKTMKTLRALRPLKAMAKMQGMRVVVNALVGAIPSITNVLMVCLIFWLIFAIMGVQLFSGKFHKCLDPSDGSRPDYRVIRNKEECLGNNFTWENSYMNFDHVPKAYLCLFQVATFKGWIGIMNDAIDSRELDEQPYRESSFAMYGYFVIFIIFGSFFTLNLLVGVIIDNFNEQQKNAGGSTELLLTEDQKKYRAAMQKMAKKKPIKAIPKPTWKPQLMVFEFVSNKLFDLVVMLLIGGNMIIMMMDHYKMSPAWSSALSTVNTMFVGIFTAESLLKMFAFRGHYFKEPWNLFDVVVVFMSIAGMFLSELIEKYFVSPTMLRIVRVAKVGRVLRLVKGAKGIRTLLFSLAMSLPALFNICLLLFLVMFIFAIFGMSFFMNVKLTGALDEVYNFRTFAQSFILLFQMSTSAGWDGVMEGIINEQDCETPDPELGKAGDCGNATVGITFLLAYLVITFLVIINMYIAVILDNYSQATEEVQEGLTDDDYDMYYEIWAQFDPDGTQFIPYDQLSDLLDILEEPLQIYKPNKFKIIVMNIPICEDDMMYCVDILDALTKDFFARKGNAIDDPEDINDVPMNISNPNYKPVSSTLQRQREEYCARLLQRWWTQHKSQ